MSTLHDHPAEEGARISELSMAIKEAEALRNRDLYRENFITELRNERDSLRDTLTELTEDARKLRAAISRVEDGIRLVHGIAEQVVSNTGCELNTVELVQKMADELLKKRSEEEEINREVAGIDIAKMADEVRDRIAQAQDKLRTDELRLNGSECPFCRGQSETIRNKCTHKIFDMI